MKTWTWSSLELMTPSRKAASLRLHGHTMVPDLRNENTLLIFGGRETGDWRAAKEGRMYDQISTRRAKIDECKTWVLNLVDCTLSPLTAKNKSPESRYGHVCVVPGPVSKAPDLSDPAENVGRKSYIQKALHMPDPSELLERTPPPEEDVLYVFGGNKAVRGGFCTPDIHVLVRLRTVEREDGSGKGNKDDSSIASSLSQDGGRRIYVRPSPLELDSPKNDIMSRKLESALASGHVPSTYGEIKQALLISLTNRIHGDDPLSSSSSIFDSTSQGSRRPGSVASRGSRNNSARSLVSGSRRLNSALPQRRGSISPTLQQQQQPLIYSKSAGSGMSILTSQKVSNDVRPKLYSSPRAESLSQQLPPLIHGLTLTAARKEFHKIFPPPTIETLFVEGSETFPSSWRQPSDATAPTAGPSSPMARALTSCKSPSKSLALQSRPKTS